MAMNRRVRAQLWVIVVVALIVVGIIGILTRSFVWGVVALFGLGILMSVGRLFALTLIAGRSSCGFWRFSYSRSGRFRTPVLEVFVHP